MKLPLRRVSRPADPGTRKGRIRGDPPKREPCQTAASRAPAHPITVPLHNPLKTGTLHGILAEVALMRSTTIESLSELL
jgi:hypothetical protein